MRTILGLMVVVGIGWLVVYFVGGYATFDPDDQGKKVRGALATGMTHRQVFDLTGDPRKYRIINKKVKRVRGEDVESLVPSAPVDFDRARVDAHLANNGLPDGFNCRFDYSARLAFSLTFDGAGILTEIDDAPTMADLLQTRD